MPEWQLTDEEFERQLSDARAYDDARAPMRATRAEFRAATQDVQIDLANGTTFTIPVRLLQGLGGASNDLLAGVEVSPLGDCIRWDAIDADFDVEALLKGVFGGKAWMQQLRNRMRDRAS